MPIRHGHACKGRKSATWSIWYGMVKRCTHPGNPDYRRYGPLGVSKDWLQFENFLRDMGEKPAGLSLDRRDNSKGYSKENCRWATQAEQSQNSLRTRLSPEKIKEVFDLRAQGWSQDRIALSVGAAQTTVSRVLLKRIWRNIHA